jgi:hypothetical protein
MLQKIENLFVRIYNYIKYHLREVVIVFLVLAVLFLLGDKLGWNDLIRNFITDLFVYLSTRKTTVVNLVLAIGSTISAIFAVIISIRANRISKIALESERPLLEFNFDGNNNFLLTNKGNTDAVNLHILVKPQNEEFYIAENNLNITAGIKEMKYPSDFVKNKKHSVVILYQNPLTNDNYMLGYNVESKTSGINQLANEQGLLNYQE